MAVKGLIKVAAVKVVVNVKEVKVVVKVAVGVGSKEDSYDSGSKGGS